MIFVGNNKGFGGCYFGLWLVFVFDGILFMIIGDCGEDQWVQDLVDYIGLVLCLI